MKVCDFVAVDIETTGVAVTRDKIIEIGAVKVIDGKVVERFSELIDPGVLIPPLITDLTGITQEDVAGKRHIDEVIEDFVAFAEDYPLLGHNISFDYSFLKQNAANASIDINNKVIDTVKISRKRYPHLESRRLNHLSEYLGVTLEKHHRAFDDAMAAGMIYLKMADEQNGLCDYMSASNDEKIFEPYVCGFKIKKQSPITNAQKKYLIDLYNMHGLTMDFDVEELSKSEASRKIDKILSQYGRKW